MKRIITKLLYLKIRIRLKVGNGQLLYLIKDLTEKDPALAQVGERFGREMKGMREGGYTEVGTMLKRVQCPVVRN